MFGIRKRNKLKKGVIVSFIAIYFLSGFPWAALTANASASIAQTWADSILNDWTPVPGVNQGASPFGQAGTNGMLPANGPQMPSVQPTLDMNPPQSESHLPLEPVSLPSGSVVLRQEDFQLNSPGFPIQLQRQYLSDKHDHDGAFGYGWYDPYARKLQMFANFDIVEYRPDGSQVKYAFHPANSDAYVDSYDGDSLIYYNLDQGSYISDEPYGSSLVRIDRDEYRITDQEGNVYTYKGYAAPWREGQDPAAGKIIAMEDRNHNRLTFTYDSEGRLGTITDSVGRQVSFGYNGPHIVSFTDVMGRTTQYQYDGNANLSAVRLPGGTSWSYDYDSDHRLTRIASPGFGSETFAYEGGRVVEIKRNGLLAYSYRYNDDPKYVERSDVNGGNTKYVYDDRNRIVEKVDAEGGNYHYQYTDTGRISRTESPKGIATEQYDEHGRVVTQTDENGTKTETTYNEWGQPLTVHLTSSGGEEQTWSNTYDDKGNLIQTTDPMNHHKSYTYNELGLLLTETDERGSTTAHTYDAFGQLKSMKDPFGKQILYEYGEDGRLQAATNKDGGRQTFQYDTGGRITSVTDALGNKTVYNYDSYGRLSTYTDALQHAYSYTYDDFGRVKAVLEPTGALRSYSYDLYNRLTKMEGPQGAYLAYSYDKLGRWLEKSGNLGADERVHYDQAGRPTDRTVGGLRYTYAYNTMNQLDLITIGSTKPVKLSYDSWGRLTKMEMPGGRTLSRTYDPLGRVVGITDANGNTATYEYDESGNLIGITDAFGRHSTSR